MEKIANQIVDIYDDVHGAYLSKFGSERPETNIMTPKEKASLADDDYALSYITKEAQKFNKFPVDSFDNTWLSNKMYPHTHHKIAKEAAVTAAVFIKKACNVFGIKADQTVEYMAKEANDLRKSNVYFEPVEKVAGVKGKGYWTDLFSKNVGQVKTASSRGLENVQEIADNYTKAQYAMPDAEAVKTAAEYFSSIEGSVRNKETLHKYAAAIQLRAGELGMEPLKGAVSKYASDCYNGQVDAHLASRKLLVDHDEELKGTLSKLASARSSMDPYQFAQILSGFDKKAGLVQYYGGYLKDPYQSSFGELKKTDPVLWSTKTASRKLTEQEVRMVVNDKNGKIAEHFGKHFAEELKKDPVSIFNSLPMDSKEIIANINDGLL